MDAKGWCYSAGTSHRMPGQLLWRGDVLRVVSEHRALLAEGPIADVQIDAQIGRLPRKLTFPDGTVFETEDFDSIAALEGETRSGLLHRLEHFHPRLIAFVLLGFLGGFLVYRFVLSGFVVAAVALTPQPLVKAMDASTLQTLDVAIARPSTLSEAEKEEARAIFEHLINALPANEADREFTLLFRELRGMGPNALALPGGTVVLTDALARQFDEDVVAAVLGHEIGHVVEDHGLKRVYRSLGIFVLVSLIAGETGPILEEILLEGNLLLSLSYSRDQEREADQFGLRLADAAGYDPAGLLVFFIELTKMRRGQAERDWFSTHPAPSERIETIEGYLDGN